MLSKGLRDGERKLRRLQRPLGGRETRLKRPQLPNMETQERCDSHHRSSVFLWQNSKGITMLVLSRQMLCLVHTTSPNNPSDCSVTEPETSRYLGIHHRIAVWAVEGSVYRGDWEIEA